MDRRATICFWAIFQLISGESSSKPHCIRSGENVYLHLQHRKTNLSTLSWAYSNENKSNSVVANFNHNFKSSAELFQNGTLKITNIQTNWSVNITATGYNDRGVNIVKEIHHLLVLDTPVVELVLCINEASAFYCANKNGQDVTHRWTVNNSALGEETVFSNSNKHLFLKNTSGSVRCSVEKKGCVVQSEPQYISCRKHSEKEVQPWCVSALISISSVLLCLIMAGLLTCLLRTYRQHLQNMNSEEHRPPAGAISDNLIYCNSEMLV
ncbi:uncharacterized protein LOC108923056 [Scleropages formosus]|uniref:uncharacterized protein LOC108923056 n=1 Tax=Scleropages formosus TaxID=113540 RepID=UPI0010FAB6E9|nr:uncharacterized protein LOC108923056 [Scleropages formosus]